MRAQAIEGKGGSAPPATQASSATTITDGFNASPTGPLTLSRRLAVPSTASFGSHGVVGASPHLHQPAQASWPCCGPAMHDSSASMLQYYALAPQHRLRGNPLNSLPLQRPGVSASDCSNVLPSPATTHDEHVHSQSHFTAAANMLPARVRHNSSPLCFTCQFLESH
jgi:hypothetical protein